MRIGNQDWNMSCCEKSQAWPEANCWNYLARFQRVLDPVRYYWPDPDPNSQDKPIPNLYFFLTGSRKKGSGSRCHDFFFICLMTINIEKLFHFLRSSVIIYNLFPKNGLSEYFLHTSVSGIRVLKPDPSADPYPIPNLKTASGSASTNIHLSEV